MWDRYNDTTTLRIDDLRFSQVEDHDTSGVEPVMQLIGDPARRDELRLPGGHVTFGTGRSAVKHTMPRLAAWIAEHSDELPQPEER